MTDEKHLRNIQQIFILSPGPELYHIATSSYQRRLVSTLLDVGHVSTENIRILFLRKHDKWVLVRKLAVSAIARLLEKWEYLYTAARSVIWHYDFKKFYL